MDIITTAPLVIFYTSFHMMRARRSTVNLQQPEFVNRLPGPYLNIEVCELTAKVGIERCILAVKTDLDL